MNYEQEDFFKLVDAVEAQGGELTEGLCKATRYEFTGEHGKPVTIGGCGNQSLFEVPYEGIVGKDGSVEPGVFPITVCAVDDDMGRWPRFGGDRFAREDA